MAEEITAENVVSEPVVEPAPAPVEPTPENGSNGTEGVEMVGTPTAQPVEPLAEEPAPEPDSTSSTSSKQESSPQAKISTPDAPIEPEPMPEAATAPVEPTPASTSSPQATPQTQTPVEPPPQPTANIPNRQELLVLARASIQNRKRKKFDKILEALNTKPSITNDEVEKLLHVSDATATRYLSILEKEGKIKQEGRTGKFVSYSRI